MTEGAIDEELDSVPMGVSTTHTHTIISITNHHTLLSDQALPLDVGSETLEGELAGSSIQVQLDEVPFGSCPSPDPLIRDHQKLLQELFPEGFLTSDSSIHDLEEPPTPPTPAKDPPAPQATAADEPVAPEKPSGGKPKSLAEMFKEKASAKAAQPPTQGEKPPLERVDPPLAIDMTETVQGLRREVGDLTHSLQEKEEDIRKLRQVNQLLQEKMSEGERLIESLRSTIMERDDMVSHAQASMNALRCILHFTRIIYHFNNGVRSENQELSDKFNALQRTNAQLQKTMDAMRQDMTSFEESTDHQARLIVQERDMLRQKLDALEQKAAAQEGELQKVAYSL